MSFDPDRTISAPIPRPAVVIALREQGSGREYPLDLTSRRLIVGKSASCDVVLDDPYVSSVHCVLERRADGTLLLRDSDSKNGTKVNGCPVAVTDLVPGSVIGLGRSRLVAQSIRGEVSAVAQLRGRDPRFRAAVDMALRAALSDCSVFIVGETGTGKELIARAVHETSRRAGQPFVALNCGAISRELIGAELFGHMPGAFTGAVGERAGVFVQASGGTLFLDELGELPLDQQPNLLRVLETRRVRPLGGELERPVDVRIVAATNRLDGLGTAASPLRLDIYHRLAVVVVQLPPLRARREDLIELAEAFLDELAPEHGRRHLSPGAIAALLAHDWPGNVRELRGSITRAVTMTDGEIGAPALALGTSESWSGAHEPTISGLGARPRCARCRRRWSRRWLATSASCATRWRRRWSGTVRCGGPRAIWVCRSRRSPTRPCASACSSAAPPFPPPPPPPLPSSG